MYTLYGDSGDLFSGDFEETKTVWRNELALDPTRKWELYVEDSEGNGWEAIEDFN